MTVIVGAASVPTRCGARSGAARYRKVATASEKPTTGYGRHDQRPGHVGAAPGGQLRGQPSDESRVGAQQGDRLQDQEDGGGREQRAGDRQREAVGDDDDEERRRTRHRRPRRRRSPFPAWRASRRAPLLRGPTCRSPGDADALLLSAALADDVVSGRRAAAHVAAEPAGRRAPEGQAAADHDGTQGRPVSPPALAQRGELAWPAASHGDDDAGPGRLRPRTPRPPPSRCPATG